MKKWIFALILAIPSLVWAQAPVTGQITAVTTNATCVGGTQVGGAVDQTVPSSAGAVGVSVTGTWVATLNIQASVDHGKTWTAQGSTFTSNQQSVVAAAGFSDVCVFASAFTSGTAIVTFATSSASPVSGSGTGVAASQVQGTAAAGGTSVGNPVLIGAFDANNNAVRIASANATSALNVAEGGGGNDADGQANSSGASIAVRSVNGNFGQLDIRPFLFNGTTWDRAITCPNTSTFNIVSTTTQVIAASGSTKIRICSFDINPSTVTAGTTDLVYGTGTNCATGLTTLTGAYTLPAAAVVDITPSTLSASSPLTTPASQAVCVRAVTSTVNGFIVWEQH